MPQDFPRTKRGGLKVTSLTKLYFNFPKVIGGVKMKGRNWCVVFDRIPTHLARQFTKQHLTTVILILAVLKRYKNKI